MKLISQRQPQLDAFCTAYLATTNPPAKPSHKDTGGACVPESEGAILARAFDGKNGSKIQRLYHGDTSGYKSESEADLAICSMLAFYFGPDGYEPLEQVLRGSQRYRSKWDEKRGGSTWIKDTIRKAIDGCKKFDGNRDKTPNTRENIADRLMGLVEDEDVSFFYDDRGETFGQFFINDHYENWPIKSDRFKSWLSYRFYQEQGKAPSDTALKDALRTMAARCLFEGKQIVLSVRVANQEYGILLDLGDDQWQAVRITPTGWEVVSNEQE